MKKMGITWSVALMLVVLAACGKSPAPQQTQVSTAGTYEAIGYGYGGEVKIAVTTDGQKMTDIQLLSHKESSPVVTRAFPVIKDRILEAQSPVVDSVSGASFTSFAVKYAVADAAKKFGKDYGSITFMTKGPEAPRKELEDVHTKLVIVGGGPAGLAAAITAREEGLEDIILIEKLDILSGNGKFDMNFFDLVDSEAMRRNGTVDSPADFIAEKKNALDSPERVEAWADEAAELDAWLRGMGVELNHNYGLRNHMAEVDAYAGERIQDGMEARIKELGIDVRTGTKGYDLIMDGDTVVGVKVQNKNNYYSIYADIVLMATGGFAANKELLAQYAPGGEIVATSNQMGATGDFVPVFEKYGFKMEHMDTLSVFKLINQRNRELTGAGDGFIMVNADGKRFAAENGSGLPLAHAILDQPDGKVFYIYDQRLKESMYRLEKHNKLGYHTQANTLEELAQVLGINGENLKAEVKAYNEAVEGKRADAFRKSPFSEKLSETGPYYGAQVESAIHMTKGGVVANEKAQVLWENDVVVKGLYAAGEVTATTAAYSGSVAFGRIAARHAVQELLAK